MNPRIFPSPAAILIILCSATLGLSGCRKAKTETVVETGPAPVVAVQLGSNALGALPGAVYRSQAGSAIRWQPWSRETMEHAIAFAETGHLCLGTLHANSASQTIERIINFFPEERRAQLLMDLSANLRGIVSQRLVRREDGKGRSAAIEILLNTPTIAERIFQGEFHEIKAIMTKSRELGMRTFDWALFELYNEGLISFEEAIRNADSANELRLNIKLKSARGEPPPSAFMSLSIDEEPTPEEIEEKKHQALHAQQEARRRLEDEQLQQLREKRRLAEGAAGPAR